MYISDLKKRKRVILLSVLASIIMLIVTNNFYTLYRIQLHNGTVDVPFIEVKLWISVLVTIVTVFFTFRTIMQN